MCLAGVLSASWPLAQEVAGASSSPFTEWYIFVSEFDEISDKNLQTFREHPIAPLWDASKHP